MKNLLKRICLASAILLLTTQTLPLLAQTPWETHARAYANEINGNQGLNHLVDGLSKIQINSTNNEMDLIIKHGWTKQYQQTLQDIEKNRAALKSIYLAGGMENTKLPPVKASGNFEDVMVPNFLCAQVANKLTLCHARFLESQGELDQAVDLALHAAWVSTFFSDENQILITHLVGIAGQKNSFIVLQSLLKNPKLSEAKIKDAGGQLYKMEQRRKGVYHALAVESHFKEETIRSGFEEAQSQKKTLSQEELANFPPDKRKLYEQMLATDIEEVLKENEKLWDLILTNAQKSYWERDDFMEGWTTDHTSNPFVAMAVPNYTEGSVRDETALARLRICQRICAIRLGKENMANNFLDPFTGRPLLQSGDIVYSVGPDMKDQEGKIIYDPTNGTISSGDVGVTP